MVKPEQRSEEHVSIPLGAELSSGTDGEIQGRCGRLEAFPFDLVDSFVNGLCGFGAVRMQCPTFAALHTVSVFCGLGGPTRRSIALTSHASDGRKRHDSGRCDQGERLS